MASIVQKCGEGLVYGGLRRRIKLDEAIPLFCRTLKGSSPAATFRLLVHELNAEWSLREDLVNPFGGNDRRHTLFCVWTIDLDTDELTFSDGEKTLRLPLARFRDDSPVNSSDFTPAHLPSPPQLDTSLFPDPFWVPSDPIPGRLCALVPQLIRDFAEQWRHVLRNSYNDIIFFKLANAILSLATLEFDIEELVSDFVRLGPRRGYVRNHIVPTWESPEERITHVDHATIVLDQDLKQALRTVEEFAEPGNTLNKSPMKETTYVLLSLRHIMLCKVDTNGHLIHTPPTPFIDGINPPPQTATNLLIQGLPRREIRRTRLHTVPIELQDRIVHHSAESSFNSAILGCVLSLGSGFKWTRKVKPGKEGGPVKKRGGSSDRFPESAVEAKIRFKGGFSGLSYK